MFSFFFGGKLLSEISIIWFKYLLADGSLEEMVWTLKFMFWTLPLNVSWEFLEFHKDGHYLTLGTFWINFIKFQQIKRHQQLLLKHSQGPIAFISYYHLQQILRYVKLLFIFIWIYFLSTAFKEHEKHLICRLWRTAKKMKNKNKIFFQINLPTFRSSCHDCFLHFLRLARGWCC